MISKKADSSHNHAISDITNLQNTLDSKASSNHTHTIANITNLQTTLDGKASSNHNHDTIYSKLSHTHAISDITNLQSTLDSKAASNHTHNYLPLSGGTMSGNINMLADLNGTGTVTWDNVDQNTSIKFSTTADSNQLGALVWNCFDSYQKPASLTFLGNQGGEYFIAPNIKATSTIYEGGIALSSKYLLLSGGTLTGNLNSNYKDITGLNWLLCDDMGQDKTMSIMPMQNNEINFGGTDNSSTIYFGYRARGSKPIPTDFKFGGEKGTANIFAHLYHTNNWYGHLVRPTSSSPGTHEMYWAY